MVDFVGAGPGAPDLITQRGAVLLQAADCIIYAGSLVNPALLGLAKPGCAIYNKRTIFDIVLPRLMACDMILADELAGLGEGGLCLNCDVCTFPNCGFGKGF